ncbi:alpha/beta hydrolase [Spongiimicrobium salis]|uniref:alpha/beta hydrolase n=1 Tax=Spongiimicrobium salis TaxID=1667022 RepID=UPI00374D02CD
MKNLLIALCVLAFFSCKETSSPKSAQVSFAQNKDGEDEISGYLVVPENRNQPNGKKIQLAYRVLKARNKNTKKEPILYLQGGPGGATLLMESFWQNHTLRSDRDIVLMDQRGTGSSNAICTDFGEAMIDILAQDLLPEEEYSKMQEIMTKCKKEAQKNKTDLSAYNSRENAADFESLRKKLGYERWNILGGSYGSRLGMTIMRDFPSSVRSAIIFGVFAPESAIYAHFMSNFKSALFSAFEECENDSDCNTRYPDLKEAFFSALHKIEQKPMVFTYDGKPFYLNVQDVLLITHQLLYSRSTVGIIPSFIQALHTQNEPVIRRALRPTSITTRVINFAMYMSVMAYEELPFNGTAAFMADLKSNPEFSTGPAFFHSDAKILENWHSHRSETLENDPVVSAIPTLVVNGRLDPITPTSNARQASKSLQNSYVMEFQREGHSVFNSCFFEICQEFLDAPETAPDMSCAQKEHPLSWY